MIALEGEEACYCALWGACDAGFLDAKDAETLSTLYDGEEEGRDLLSILAFYVRVEILMPAESLVVLERVMDACALPQLRSIVSNYAE